MKRLTRVRRVIAAAVLVTVGFAVAGGTAATQKAEAVGTEYYPVSGVGSTWSANALQQWIRNVWNNYRWKIEYSDQGSSAGRQLFAQQGGGYDFAVSEIPYALQGGDVSDPRPPRQFAYMPIVAGGTSFMYNLVIGGKRVTNLRLSGENVAKIFTGQITVWNDPAIAADNPKLALPATPIVPVVRSDGSGTTAQFTTWMIAQHPNIWNAYCAATGRANCGITSSYPVQSGSAFVGQSGSNGVAGYVAQPQYVGSITYVEYSYALNAGFPVAKVLNNAGFYTEPTAANVAVALLGAAINNDSASPDYLTQQLGGVYNNGDPRTYPLSSYSYMIIPTALEFGFTENKGLTLAAFSNYFLCEGQQQAEVLGYSPLPINLAQAGLDQVKRIPGGDPSAIDIARCNNPTFSPDGGNRLAAEAPQPAECDRRGADQCLTGTGGARGQGTDASGGAGAGGAAGGGTGGPGGAGGAEASTGDGGAAANNAAAGGDVSSLENDTRPAVVAASPVDLPVSGGGTVVIVATLVALILLVGFILVPPMLSRRRASLAGRPRGPSGSGRPRPAGGPAPAVHSPLPATAPDPHGGDTRAS